MSVFASRPLVFSALLHASAAGLLLALMLRMQRDPAPEPFIVDWGTVAAPSPAAPDTRTATPAVSPAVNFNPVRVAAPVRTPVAEEAVTETPERSRAVVRTTAPAQPATARTTITEHRRRNPATATPAAPVRPSPAAHINMGEVLAEAGPVRAQPAVAADPAQSAAYWDRLLGKLRVAHEKPAGLDDGLVVRVEFLLREDGTVGDVRILASSGSAEFDASVVAAFRRLGGLGPPPASRAGLNQVTFRTRAE